MSAIARRRSRTVLRFGIAAELVRVLWRGGRWWLLPMLVVLGVAGLLLAAVQAVEYVAPFVYTVF